MLCHCHNVLKVKASIINVSFHSIKLIGRLFNQVRVADNTIRQKSIDQNLHIVFLSLYQGSASDATDGDGSVYLSRQTLLHSLIHLAFPQFIQIRISFSFLVY
jgi:hypothetical protein